MKCPNDQTEMEAGKIIMPGANQWFPLNGEKEGYDEKKILGMSFLRPKDLIAYRCPKYGKVELMTKSDEEEN